MGGKDISDETIRKVKRMFDDGVDRRWIAEHFGISLTSVTRIGSGKLQVKSKLQFGRSKYHECPGCKHMINVDPCVACAARKWKEGKHE